MPKNVVLLHLESLSSELFWNYQAQLPYLWKLRNESMYFSRCYASGSATSFSMQSLQYGHQGELDAVQEYSPEHLERHRPSRSSFSEWIYRQSGCDSIFCHMTDNTIARRALERYSYYAGLPKMPCDEQSWQTGLATWLQNRNKRNPFLIFLTPHPMDTGHTWFFSGSNQTGHVDLGELTANVVRRLDSTFEQAMDVIGSHVSLDDCLVVAYGDHGIEWNRKFFEGNKLRGGFSTRRVTWVPLFIAGGEWEAGVTDQLASLDDLPFTIAGQLFDSSSQYDSDAPFAGVDLARQQRPHAFSQNKFALQNVYARGGDTAKSYSITDGVYRLLVSEINQANKTGGLEMYLEAFDYMADIDLLGLFKFNRRGEPIGLFQESFPIPPITFLLTNNLFGIQHLMEKYLSLRACLMEYVETKEKLALSRPGAEANILTKESFCFAAIEWNRNPDIPWKPLPPSKQECLRRLAALAAERDSLLIFGDRKAEIDAIEDLLSDLGRQASGIVDNNSALHGLIRRDLTIMSPQEAAGKFPGALMISTLSREGTNAAAAEQCRQLGFHYCALLPEIFDRPLTPKQA